jgi:hypothetical protein
MQKTKIDFVIGIRKNMNEESSHLALFTREAIS